LHHSPFPSLLVQQLLLRYVPQTSRGYSGVDNAIVGILRHNSACCHHGITTDIAAGQNDRAHTQTPAATNRCALKVIESLFGPSKKIVIARQNPWRHKDTIFKR
jgi:hypothetical protein